MAKSYSPVHYAPVETRDLKHSPNCIFYVNGDSFSPGSRLCISNRIRTFDGIKEELTKVLFKNQLQVGYVRSIFTPMGGSRVDRLDDFKDGEHYVAALNDKFKALRYREIPEKNRPSHHKGFKKIDIDHTYTPVQHALEERLRKKSGRSYYLNEHRRGLRLRVHVNGMNERPSCPVSIRYKDKDNFAKILEEIEVTMNLQPIDKIYKVVNQGGYPENFSEITDASQLEADEHILVLPKNEKRLQVKLYSLEGKNNFKVTTSPRSGQYYLYPSFPVDNNNLHHSKSLNKHKPLPSIGSSKNDTMSPLSNPPGSQGGKQANKNKSVKQVDYDKDETQNKPGKPPSLEAQEGIRMPFIMSGGGHNEEPIEDEVPYKLESVINPNEGGVYQAKKQNNAQRAPQEDIHTKEQRSPVAHDKPPNKNSMVEQEQMKNVEIKSNSKKNDVNHTKTANDVVKHKAGVANDLLKDSDKKKAKGQKFAKHDSDDIPEGHVKNTVDKYEDISKAGVSPAAKSKKSEPVRRNSPIDLKRKDAEVNKAAHTTPPAVTKGTQHSADGKNRANNDAGYHRIEDDSFNHYGHKASGLHSEDPWASTPASHHETRRKQEHQQQAAAKIQAGARGYIARKEYKAKKAGAQKHKAQQKVASKTDEQRGREKDGRQVMSQDLAASKIQASFKGYKTRKEVNEKRQQGRK